MLKNFNRLIWILFCTALCTTLSLTIPVKAQSDTPATYFSAEDINNIDKYVKQGMSENRIPGAAIALIESGKVVHIKGFGKADNAGNPVTPQTPFQLASITKTFTALLFTQLAQENKLSLDDLVIKHIPWFTSANKEQSDRITIRHLLNHYSGFSTLDGNRDQNTRYRGTDATEIAVKELKNVHLISEPGSKFAYSNANYHIASHIIEQVENKPFEQVMQTRILSRLGMNNSYIQVTDRETPPAAIGYPQWFGFPFERLFILGRKKMGDGGMVSSAEDLTKYLLEVSHGNSGVVPEQARKTLFTPPLDYSYGYGLGWEVSKFREDKVIEHGGLNGGFTNLFGFSYATDTRADIGFVILTNTSSALNNQFVFNLKRLIFKNSPSPKEANIVAIIELIALYGGILLLGFGIYRSLVHPNNKPITAWSFLMPAILLTVWYANAYLIPSMNKITLFSIYPFFPDLAVGLIGCAFLAFILAIIKIGYIIKKRLAKKIT